MAAQEQKYSRRNFIKGGLTAIAVASLPLMSGCSKYVTEESPILHEDVKVLQTIYNPSRHGSGVSPQVTNLFSDNGPNIGVQFTSIDIPEKYAVIFECQHGKFVSEGTDKRHKDLWSRLKEGQTVDVSYKEIYKVRYEKRDGEKIPVEKILIKYDFLDAQPKTNVSEQKFSDKK